MVLIFRNIEWITFTDPQKFVSDPTLNDIIVAGIIGFIIFVIGEVAGIVYQIFVIVTCCVGCLFFPIYSIVLGYIKLLGTQMLLPDWFTFDTALLKVSIISIVIGIARMPSIKERKKLYLREKEPDK